MTKTPQQNAIEKTSGPCLIMAGAGTGKTYTIIKKIAHLIENNICTPSEILCLTFSNEAAKSLTKKVEQELIELTKNSSTIKIRTFHGFCTDILKEIGYLINLDPDFELIMPEDAKVWFYRYLDCTPYYADLYYSTISTIKDFGIALNKIEKHTENIRKKLGDIQELEKYAEEVVFELNTLHLMPADTKEERKELRERKKEINEFLKNYYEYNKYKKFTETFRKYEELKIERNVLDYADLNFNVIELFHKFGADEIDNYKYVIIDEFQDTNKLQFELIEYLAKKHKNITVVGDPNQSIYGFRGAYRESFNHFKEVFGVKQGDIFTLDKSYRSPDTVLKVAHTLIKNNYENPDECFPVENANSIKGDKIKVIELKNSSEEARKVAEIVEDEIANGTELSEICVLYRTHQQGRLLRIALESKNIPIVVAGKCDLMKKPEIKTVIAYLSILNNMIKRTGTGEQAWWNLFHFHNSLSPSDSIKIGRYLKESKDISIDDALLNCLRDLELSVAGRMVVERVVLKLKELIKNSNKELPELILDIYEIVGLNRAFTHTRSIRNSESLMNLKVFYELSENYYRTHGKSISSFVDYIEILDKLGVDLDAARIENVNAIRIMTMHAVKGLEFKTVIVTNLAEKRFPIERTSRMPLIPKELNPDIKRYLNSIGVGKLDENRLRFFHKPRDIFHCSENNEKEKNAAIKSYEKLSIIYEERRLCYVSFTRAKEKLIITYARSYNNIEDSSLPSVFLEEINFRENEDITLLKDDLEKGTLFAPNSRYEQFKSMLKKQFVDSLDSDDFNSLLARLVTYHAIREGKLMNYSKIVDWDKIVDKTELEDQIKINCEKSSCLKFDPNSFTFSPTSLLTYDECPKKYELRYIFRMPERGAFEGTSGLTGSFVHEVLEHGVREGFKSKEEFLNFALEISKSPQYKDKNLDMAEIDKMIGIFWERHAEKYDNKSLVEGTLNITSGGFKFSGKFDRIDFISNDNNNKDVEIIDYKTNKNIIPPKKRAWQLGFYAIAVKKQLGLNPKKLTFEMLKLEKPFEAMVDKNGNVKSGGSRGFNIKDVESELIGCAKSIVNDYETEFLPSISDTPCVFCGYKFYCPKWEES